MSDQPVDNRIDLSNVQLGALIGVMLLSFAANIGLTYNISAIALAFEVERDFASYIGSAELFGIAIKHLRAKIIDGRRNLQIVTVPLHLGQGVVKRFKDAEIGGRTNSTRVWWEAIKDYANCLFRIFLAAQNSQLLGACR